MTYDVIVVGAGPAGLSAAVRAKKENLNVLVLEQGELANTIFNYQKKKHVMAEPAMIGQLEYANAFAPARQGQGPTLHRTAPAPRHSHETRRARYRPPRSVT